MFDTIVADMEQGVSGFDVGDSYAVPWPWDCRICLRLRQAKGMKDSSKKRRAKHTQVIAEASDYCHEPRYGDFQKKRKRSCGKVP